MHVMMPQEEFSSSGPIYEYPPYYPSPPQAQSLPPPPPPPPPHQSTTPSVSKWPGTLVTPSPQQGDLSLLGPPSGQGTGGGARTRDRSR
ncbi:hypothetical protein PoB_002183200 [Plakobranchus ocellatus]|uniref:Uncharacterized protein n=1 Tax=Plakobranchus ocellatus TaxID=259542 RepID=A0AAV3ZJ32_9GAST|nr:hypothetical protein PoB_002183200 [Plakobranchus ocellatus]